MMSPAERNKALANRTPESRARIMAKVREYQVLPPDERELRLRATELRWYLVPLLRTPPGQRDTNLTQVPPELRQIVKGRLLQWDLLPPSLKTEFLTNDQTLHYFTGLPNPAATSAEQQKIEEQFDQFLKLTPGEEKKLLGTLSGAERAKMEQTLESFQQLPLQQRALCLRNYAKFAGMSSGERAEFLKNAESWSKMSPQERQTWRDLVQHVPIWPVPPSIMPPLPPTPTKAAKSGMATN